MKTRLLREISSIFQHFKLDTIAKLTFFAFLFFFFSYRNNSGSKTRLNLLVIDDAFKSKLPAASL